MHRKLIWFGIAIAIVSVRPAGASGETGVTTRLRFCESRELLLEQHPGKYTKRYTDWKLPVAILYHRSSRYDLFRSEHDGDVCLDLGSRGQAERVRAISCAYRGTRSRPGQQLPYAYDGRSYLETITSPRTSALFELTGYAVHRTTARVSAAVDLRRIEFPAAEVDRKAIHTVTLELHAQSQEDADWVRVTRREYALTMAQRRKLAAEAYLPAGHHRVLLRVFVRSTPAANLRTLREYVRYRATKSVRMRVHDATLTTTLEGMRDESDLHARLDRLEMEFTYLMYLLEVRRLLHAEYIAGVQGMQCIAHRSVSSFKQAAEIAAGTYFLTYDEWRSDPDGALTAGLAEATLYEAQYRGAIPAGSDVWRWLTDNEGALLAICGSIATELEPTEDAFAGYSDDVKQTGTANARAYAREVQQLQAIKDEAGRYAWLLDLYPIWLDTP